MSQPGNRGESDNLFGPDVQAVIVKYSPLFSEIRKRLLFTASIFVIAASVGFLYYKPLVQFMLRLFALNGLNIVFTSPFQFLTLSVNSALLAGFIAISPAALFQILGFVRPALARKEYRTVLILIPVGLLLFAGGFVFGVSIMKYVVLVFYKNSVDLNIGNYIDVSLFLSQVLLTAALMGIAFQYPIVLTLLMRLRIVSYQSLVKKRMYIYLASYIFAALLPPTDLLSLVLMTVPLLLLFELTMLVNRHLLRSHEPPPNTARPKPA